MNNKNLILNSLKNKRGDLDLRKISFLVLGLFVLIGFVYLVSAIQEISTVTLNATSGNNLTTDNLTATVSVLNLSQSYLYEWFKDGLSGGVFLGDGASQNTIPNWFTTVGETWQVNATPKILTNNYNVSNASFVASFNVSGEESAPTGMAFNNDGTKLYMISALHSDINEYNLSTPFNVSTGIFVDNFSVSEQDTIPTGMAFNNDGTKIYVVGESNDFIHEYNLSTPFNVSTMAFVDSFDVSAEDTGPRGMAFNNDGTKLYVIGADNDAIHEYNLLTAFDVSTGTFNDNFSVSAQETTPDGMAFNNDGTKIYVIGIDTDTIYEYNLSTPFDVSTGENVSSFNVSAQDTIPSGMAFNNDGTKLYVVGVNSNTIYEYDVGSVENGVTVQSNNLTIIEISSTETSSGGGGGGGGSSCTYDVNYDWECGEWDTCINGEQTRTCNEVNNCGNSFGRSETIRTCEGLQLFDITFSLDDSTISSSDELSAVVTFEGFGTIAAPVDLTFIILDEFGDELYREERTITVTVEEVLGWNYETLQNLPEGKYTAVLETLYNIDVFDEFRQEFEIVGKRGLGIIGSIINFIRSEGNLLIGIIAIGVLVIGLAWWLIKRR
ncbi:MAG: beta-propeller fold lactonase family protein, partial [Nanoarchaeota archaeon]|nr:beta-propeller fold lactonase family protein [Nanoarchaeota archaeon]